MRLTDDQALPLPAETLLDRSRTDWFPDFLSHGQMKPHFQPIVELATGRAFGREALMRGKLGAIEVRGGELLAAAEAHDALFSFDYRARTAALEIGLPLLPDGEVLFVNLDPRAVLDVEGSLRTTWPVVGRMGADPSRICLELVKPERCPDRDMLHELVEAHRKRGALVALDDMSGGADSLLCLEILRPDIVKIDNALTAGIQHSPARRNLVAALVECAHEQGCKVVAEGIERVDEFQAMLDLGVDLGQGFYFGQPDRAPHGGRRAPRAPARRAGLAAALGWPTLSGVAGQRDLFANFERMRREMDELFGDVFDPPAGIAAARRLLARRRRLLRRRPAARGRAGRPRRHRPRRRGARDPRPRADPRRPARARSPASDRVYQQLEIEHGPFRRVVALGADVDAEAATRGLRERHPRRRAAARAAAPGAQRADPALGGRVIDDRRAAGPAGPPTLPDRLCRCCRCATRCRSPTR